MNLGPLRTASSAPLLKRIAMAAPLVLLLQLAAPAPANAESWFLTTNGDGTGYGEAGGSGTFPDRVTFKISGDITDICGSGGGDGRGIYLRGRVVTRAGNGDYTIHRTGVIASDTNGCGSTPVSFGPKRYSYSERIHYVELWLCEEDHDKSGTECLRSSSVETLRNPN